MLLRHFYIPDDGFVVVPNSIDEESSGEKDEIRKSFQNVEESNRDSDEKSENRITIAAEPDFDRTKTSSNNVKVTSTSFDGKQLPQKIIFVEEINTFKNEECDGVCSKIEDNTSQTSKEMKIDVVKNIPLEHRNIENAHDLQTLKALTENIFEKPAVKDTNSIDNNISSIESVLKEIQNSVFPNPQLPSEKKSRFLTLEGRSDSVPIEASVRLEENVIGTKHITELFNENQDREKTMSLPDSTLFFDSFVNPYPFTMNINSLFLYLYDTLFEPPKDYKTVLGNANEKIPGHSDFEDFLFSHGPS